MNIGLYFGAFNPVHDGHVSVANYVLNNCKLDKVWLILTPQSPHKRNNILIDFKHRYSMLQIAFKKHKNIVNNDFKTSQTLLWSSQQRGLLRQARAATC